MKQKMIEVSEDTHLKIKTQAAMRKMSMREYIDWLADNDKKVIMKGIK